MPVVVIILLVLSLQFYPSVCVFWFYVGKGYHSSFNGNDVYGKLVLKSALSTKICDSPIKVSTHKNAKIVFLSKYILMSAKKQKLFANVKVYREFTVKIVYVCSKHYYLKMLFLYSD